MLSSTGIFPDSLPVLKNGNKEKRAEVKTKKECGSIRWNMIAKKDFKEESND